MIFLCISVVYRGRQVRSVPCFVSIPLRRLYPFLLYSPSKGNMAPSSLTNLAMEASSFELVVLNLTMFYGPFAETIRPLD